jgi:hypothetical protein
MSEWIPAWYMGEIPCHVQTFDRACQMVKFDNGVSLSRLNELKQKEKEHESPFTSRTIRTAEKKAAS